MKFMKNAFVVLMTGILLGISAVRAQDGVTPPAEETPPPVPETPPAPAAEPAKPIAIPTPPAPAAPPPAPVRAPAPVANPCGQPLDKALDLPMSFQGSPVNAVLEFYGRLTCRSVIQAPNIQGQVWFNSASALTIGEAIQALDTVLAINGIAVLPVGEKFLKVVQIATAKSEGPPVGVGTGAKLPAADGLVTQIIPLKFAEAAEAAQAIQPYLHAYGQLLPLPKSNSLLITDTSQNINQMLEIIKYIDQPSALRVETKVYTIKYAKAADVASRLQQIVQEAQQMGAAASTPTPPQPNQPPQPRVLTRRTPETGGSAGGEAGSVVEGKVILSADERTNKIFILSRPSNFDFFDRLISELDAKVEPDVITKVIPLQYASAEDVSGQLSALISGGSFTPASRTRTSGTTQPTGSRTPPPPSVPSPVASSGGGGQAAGLFEFGEGVRILPDPRTNSLLVMATKSDMERLEQLVASIDTAVAQVVIEVVIAEVKLGNNLNVGVSALKRMFTEGKVTQTGTTGTPGGTPGPTDLKSLGSELFSGIVSNAAPIALGAATGGLSYYATFNNLKLDAAVQLVAGSSRFKVLSRPVIQTQHNQEANIIVGESRPVITSSVSDINSSASTAVRSNVEFKDIAIELKVTPRINPDGYVTMEIEQKINDVGGNVKVNGTDIPIITKREAKSSVAVRDGSTIVLGGLIKEDKTIAETKVPFLGDIPLLGTLFKTKSTDKNRTELIVFIRPVVIRTDQQALAEAKARAAKMKAGKELNLGAVIEGRDEEAESPKAKDKPAPEKKTPPPAAPEPAPKPSPTTNFGPRAE